MLDPLTATSLSLLSLFFFPWRLRTEARAALNCHRTATRQSDTVCSTVLGLEWRLRTEASAVFMADVDIDHRPQRIFSWNKS